MRGDHDSRKYGPESTDRAQKSQNIDQVRMRQLTTKSYWVFSTKVIFVFEREFLNLSHPILSPLPDTVDINQVEDIGKRDDKCTFENLSTAGNHTIGTDHRIPGDRILPLVVMKKRREGHQSTSFGMTNSDNFHESNESETDVVEYCVYGTLLVTCLIVLLLW